MPDLMGHLRVLAEEIGPRPSTKEGERRAGDLIAKNFKGRGCTIEEMPFSSVPSFSYPYGVIFLVSLISAGLLLAGHSVSALVLSSLCYTVFHLENNSFPTISALMSWGRSRNILAKIPPRGVGGRLVIVSAHYDSSRSGLSFDPRFVGNFRASFLATAWSLRILPLFCLPIPEWPVPAWLSLVPASVIAFGLIMLIHREVFGEYVAGANDNASGTSVLLGLAEELGRSPLKNTEVWLLATGCEEANITGMVNFIRKYKEKIGSALCINVDHVGKGAISYVTEEGMLTKFRSAPVLLECARTIAPALGVTPVSFRTMSTDAVPLLARKYSAMSVMGFEDGGLPNWHWKTDTVQNIDPSSLDTAYRFVRGLLGELDRGRRT